MPWTDSYRFDEPMERVPAGAMADLLLAELDREVGPGHPLHGRKWTLVARALPQDEVLITSDDDVALVHLTWSRKRETPPWPATTFLGSAAEFESFIEDRY
jgi:hypothetical protein